MDTSTRLPTGTVTFLFTDIEGSTRLLSALGEGYEPLQARHAEVLRQGLRSHEGIEVNTEGDAFFAAFPSAVQAVRCVAQTQLALATEPWPEDGIIRVRMGLHTGEGRLGGDDYAGMAVNRAARIAAAGSGGQVLLSDATRALVAQDLPHGTSLRDLGRHRLKDLPAAEHLWQLDIEGLPQEFPALASLDARPSNLPRTTTPLIGRERELARVRALLGARRLVTLTGPGGTGKTRLALATAGTVLDDFDDGAFFVPLQDARDRPAIAAAIAAVLGVGENPDRELELGLFAYLGERQLLLVLDNFEQALDAAPLVTDLLSRSPGLRVMATSRSALRLSDEQEYQVPPLGVPDPRVDVSPEALTQYEAVALFIERARAVRADFEVTNENAPAVAEICSRLDGLPLAIELAAARIRLLAPQAILARLEHRLPLLAGGSRDRPERHHTLRSTIDWSYELLDEPERRLFERLAVFAGGWTLDAAEQVSDPELELDLGFDMLAGLDSLDQKSLIRRADDDRDPTAAEPRFDMLGVIREYGSERLLKRPDAEEVLRRHARWMMELAEQAEPELVLTDMRSWQGRMRREEENLRAALQWAFDRQETEIALRTAGSLWRFWWYWATAREGCRWLEGALALPGAEVASEWRAKALTGLGGLRYWQGEAKQAAALYDEALAIRRQLGDERAIAEALWDRFWAAVSQGDMELATRHADEAERRYRSAGDEYGAMMIAAWRRSSAFAMGWGGSYEDATAAILEMVEASRRAGRVNDERMWHGSHAYMHWIAGHPDRALEHGREALRTHHELGQRGLGQMFKFLAAAELALGRADRAARLAAAARRHAEELGGEIGGALLKVGDPLEESRGQLPADAHARATEAGRSMSLDAAVAFALEDG